MTVIRVPKTPASAMNPDRPISALLKNQIEHLQHAEFRLPAKDQTNIYINKIKTEGAAAEYIRQVTARIHPEGAGRKAKPKVIRTIAAAAELKPRNNEKKTSKPKTKVKVARKRK